MTCLFINQTQSLNNITLLRIEMSSTTTYKNFFLIRKTSLTSPKAISRERNILERERERDIPKKILNVGKWCVIKRRCASFV